ncbi:MAG: hypothetical protein HFI88_10065 [Lachnospiraceae bacterium]|nr:hypothetical protein [Lachnospiraceae bacterium]
MAKELVSKEEFRKKSECISKQISSGKMTINQAREAMGKSRHKASWADEYLMSAEFCSNGM